MEIVIEKKALFVPPFVKRMKLKTKTDSTVTIVAENKSYSDKIQYELPCRVIQKGDVTIENVNILNILKNEEITIKNTTRSIFITDGNTTFKCQPDITNPISITEFDNTLSSGIIEKKDLIKAVKSLCVTTYNLLIEYDNNSNMLKLVTTDGAQMTVINIPIIGQGPQIGFTVNETSVKNMAEFVAGREEELIEIANNENKCLFIKGKDWKCRIQHMNVAFPNYKTAIDKLKVAHQIEVDVETFMHAVECAGAIGAKAVTLSSDDAGTMLSADSDYNGHYSFGPFKISDSQLHIKNIAFSQEKIRSLVKKYFEFTGKSNVELTFSGDNKSPVYVKSDNYLYVLMPLLIS